MTSYVKRTLESTLLRAAREFPAVILTGPRQSGKTTLLRHAFPRHRYVSLDPPDVRDAARADPRGFLAAFAPPVVFDEIQHAPDLLPYVKERIDAEREKPGRYLLTGSQNLLVMEKASETLAGRAALLRLLPLSESELGGRAMAAPFWERATSRNTPSSDDLWRRFIRGNFPEPALRPRRNAELWYSSYIQTYLERDVRTLRQIGDLAVFRDFMRAIAARSGQLLNLTDLSRDLGVAVNTAKAWLAVLEASHLVHVLRPWFANLGRRLVKSPKVYLTDPGLLCHLAGITDPKSAAAGPLAGPIFETALLAEIVKAFVHAGREPRLHFFRTAIGLEVDFLVESGDRLIPIEAKSAATARPGHADGIRRLRAALGDRLDPGFVVYGGDLRLPLGDGIVALPFRAI